MEWKFYSRCNGVMLVGIVGSVIALALVVIQCATVIKLLKMQVDIARIQQQQLLQQQQLSCGAIHGHREQTSQVSTEGLFVAHELN